MKVLLDESLPRELGGLLAGHEVTTVQQRGWRSKSNGELLGLAEREFDVFVTADQSLEYQQNVARFKIGVVVLAARRNRIESYLPLLGRASFPATLPSNTSSSPQIIGLVAWISVCFTAAAIGSAASIQAGSFYAQLVQPSWAPPPDVFGPVWTLLYSLMGVAAWLVWRVGGFRAARIALCLFLAQLVVNALWSWVFFGWHRGALAFSDIVLLWLLLVATLIAFWRVRPLAGALLIPYLLWVSFASALNYSVWQLNPQVLG